MQSPRRTIWSCLAILSLSLAAALFPTALFPTAATADVRIGSATEVDQATASETLLPGIAIIATGEADDDRAVLAERLGSIDGVVRVVVDDAGAGETVFYLVRSNLDGGRPVSAVAAEAERIIEDAWPGSSTLTGGSAVVDRDLRDRFAVTVVVIAAVAALLGLGLGLAFGLKRGLLAGATLAVTVGCGASIGSQVGGTFDGTLSTTAVPGALAALVVGVIVAVRLLVWFRNPLGSDGAEMIRNSIGHMLAEFALIISALAFVAVLIELLDPGRSPVTVIFISSAVSAIVMAAIMAPILAVLRPDHGGHRLQIPVALPDGRDLPLLIVGAAAVALALLSIFAFRQPGAELLDVGRLSNEDESALVAEKLAVAGGDATTAVLVYKPAEVSTEAFQRWAGTVVERPEVELVDLASGRLRSTGPVEVPAAALLVPPGSPELAAVVFNVSPRSEEGQRAVELLGDPSLLGASPQIEGYGADASALAGSRTTTVVTVIALAAAIALAMQVLTQNRSLAAVTFVVRLLGGGATVGVYRLMAPGATMAETLTVLSVLALAGGLLNLEFAALGRFGYGEDFALGDRSDRADRLEPNPGQYAAFGLAALAFACLAVAVTGLFGGGPDTGRLSLGLVAVVVVELLAGAMLLTPALLGQRGAFHTVVRPVRIALHSAAERSPDEPTGLADPTWKRIVEDLIQAEFRLQSDPVAADLDTVFVPDTPLHRQAATHHENLGKADLRIVGRSPRLRSIKGVGHRSPTTLAITVDHPERHLVARDGTVVGVRKPERRSGVLWLNEADDGSYRIAESVELGSVPLPEHADEESKEFNLDSPSSEDIVIGRRIRVDDDQDAGDGLSAPQGPPTL